MIDRLLHDYNHPPPQSRAEERNQFNSYCSPFHKDSIHSLQTTFYSRWYQNHMMSSGLGTYCCLDRQSQEGRVLSHSMEYCAYIQYSWYRLLFPLRICSHLGNNEFCQRSIQPVVGEEVKPSSARLKLLSFIQFNP